MASDRVEVAVDENLLAELPKDGKVIEATSLGLSDWCDTTQYNKARGEGGLEQIRAHWHSESSVYKFIPEYIPRPVAFREYASQPNTYFLLLEFEDMIDDDIPPPETYMAVPSALHLRSAGKSPTGKFGFPVNTSFGNLTQPNGWESSWEVWWTTHMKFLLQRERVIRGAYAAEDETTLNFYLDTVLPRYLRPLETEGRSIKPTLCHTDLWPGNVKYKLDNETIIVYDANALWAHNEIELAPFRNPRYPLGKAYFQEYWKHVPISEPEEDAESRIIIYLIRHQVCLASLYPTELKLRDAFLSNMRLLDAELENEDVNEDELFTVFTKWQKHWISLSASFSAMFSTMSSYIYYPAIVPISRDLRVSVSLINLTVTSYLIIAAIAPAFMGDMADQSGRRPIFLLMFVLMIGANVGIALQSSFPALLVLRMLQSSGASGLTAITYGVISDITLPKDRGGFVGVLLLFTDIAPSLGPVIGGGITQELGWRWIFWFLTIIISITALTMLFFFPETQRNIVGNGSANARGIYWSFFTLINKSPQRKDGGALRSQNSRRHWPNPFACLPILKDRSSLVVILLYGITYSVKMTLQTSLGAQCSEIYKLDYLTAGLIYIPSGVAGGRILNRNYRAATSKLSESSDQNGIAPSEVQIEQVRLKGLNFLVTISALGTVGYGLALMAKAHMAVMIIMQFITGITTASLFTMTGTLLTDLNCERSATAQGASSIVRCLGAGAGIAALQPLADAAGLGWCFAIYALFLATELPLAWIIRKKGPGWRKQRRP
ncbi:uncharacterized protein CCOS01_14707 [Colletotrichum costaricense]|uniref:protein-ribulosamine 3-kinase n=1 Tax=Colletotrichum costaricense TaxID=1209916 RepID=A0AAI9YJ54_9PEZI|nr:uncharacterized protein CCOS01_14707 [Colletotrichum costaricense]KAK1512467.1 hypothetical protein CCOS01_14707 [Colletotrichum costaricense]